MQVQVRYQGLEPSPWVDQFVSQRMSRIERFLGPSSSVQINIKFHEHYTTSFEVHGLFKNYVFTGEGENLYESFSSAMDKATQTLREEKMRLRNKVHRKASEDRGLAF